MPRCDNAAHFIVLFNSLLYKLFKLQYSIGVFLLEQQMLKGFTDDEKKQLRAFLKRLASNLEIREEI